RALAHRLYTTDESRFYSDADLLVPSMVFASAECVLREYGFHEAPLEVAAGPARPRHAHTWISPLADVAVDLHATLIGVGAPPDRLWNALAAETETLAIC